jgi:hypothetical protein
MKELLRGKGTKSHMAEVPKRTPRANFTFFTFVRGFAAISLLGGLGVEDQQNGLMQVQILIHCDLFLWGWGRGSVYR